MPLPSNIQMEAPRSNGVKLLNPSVPGGTNDPNDPNFQNANPTQLGPSQLLPGQRVLDSNTQGLINNKLSVANEDPNYFSGQLMNKVGNQNGLLDTSEQTSREGGALGMALPSDLQSALSRTSNNSFKNTMSNLQNNANFQAPMMKATQQDETSKMLAQNEQIKNQNYQQQLQYANNQRNLATQYNNAQAAARAGALGSILGIAGTVAGIALGGPIGGAVGSAAGGMAGKAIGSLGASDLPSANNVA